MNVTICFRRPENGVPHWADDRWGDQQDSAVVSRAVLVRPCTPPHNSKCMDMIASQVSILLLLDGKYRLFPPGPTFPLFGQNVPLF